MKILMSLSVTALIFTGCTSPKHQQMQNERNIRREAYEDARRKDTSNGTYTTWGLHNEDKPKSGGILLDSISGPRIPDLLFSFTEGIHKQVISSFGGTEELISVNIRRNRLGISMKEEQMDLTLDLGMVLAPDGWLHRGNIRCSFERIE